MRIGSLFSGAGGLDMAVEHVLRDEWKHVHEDATAHRVVKAAVWQI